jgi:hypothetical protein
MRSLPRHPAAQRPARPDLPPTTWHTRSGAEAKRAERAPGV